MGAARKLQAEIDRTLKKVQEGIHEFDDIWNKVYETDNQNQKEKYEVDLKKEIKKLQRLRDQIKTWVANNDIKDKSLLVDARKAIEREMERFKICEKGAKTKAFSRAGLGLQTKLDPEEKARQEARDWLNEQVEALQIQIDEFEAEIESLAGQSKKAKVKPHRYTHLEESVGRHKSHIMRMEQVMRCLDNDTMTGEEVEENLKEMVEWYVKENQDNPSNFEVVDDTYGDLLVKLEAVAIGSQATAAKAKKSTKEQEELEEREREIERVRERATASALKAQICSHGSGTFPLEDEKKMANRGASVSAPHAAQVIPSSDMHHEHESEPRQPGEPGASSGVHAAGDQSPTAQGTSPEKTAPVLVSQRSDGASAPGVSFASLAAGRATSGPTLSGGQFQSQRHQSVWGVTGQDGDSLTGDESAFPRLGSTTLDARQKVPESNLQDSRQPRTDVDVIPGPAGAASSAPQGVQGAAKSSTLLEQIQPSGDFGPVQQDQRLEPSETSQISTSNPELAPGVPSSNDSVSDQQRTQLQELEAARLANIVDLNQLIAELSLEGTRSEAAGVATGPGHYEGNPAASLQLLQACCRRSMPQPADSDYKSDLSHHANRITPHLPASYPTARLPQLDDPNFYEKLEQEGLFFSFYFQPGSIQQFAAAKDLKRQAWRYNIEHKAWFQRSGEPKATTKDYEQGSYIYFDKTLTVGNSENPSEVNGWCYRKKDNFTFRYDQLEDELQ